MPHNNFYVTINGEEVDSSIFPLKYGEFLDEQLDYALLTLAREEKEFYEPLTPVEILIRSDGTNGVQELTKRYLIANDDANESPNGSGFYRHDLMLIEETKYLEGFMVESLCVTNAGGRKIVRLDPTIDTIVNDSKTDIKLPEDFKTPSMSNSTLPIPTLDQMCKGMEGYYDYRIEVYWVKVKIEHLLNGTEENFEHKEDIGLQDIDINHPIGDLTILSGINIVTCQYYIKYMNGTTYTNDFELNFQFEIYGQPNRLPLKPWTIREVINRVLELAEPLVWDFSKNDYVVAPRFKFDYTNKQKATKTVHVLTDLIFGRGLVVVSSGDERYASAKVINKGEATSAAAWVSNDGKSITVSVEGAKEKLYTIEVEVELIEKEEYDLYDQLSPEFTFTRGTLREVLQEIGGFIHAEPRLTGNVITYDRYGGRELAKYYDIFQKEIIPLNEYKYTGKQISYGIEQACTRIDSYVENLINQLSAVGATVCQPYENGYQSLRTDSAYIRLGENESTIFPSAYPISKVEKFYWVDVNGKAGTAGKKYDITPYLFESTIYNSQLSSYTSVYPSSKCYGLYYKQGEKNIGGFFFKAADVTEGVLGNYAILNILRAAVGNVSLSFDSAEYMGLCFELVYVPVYSARVAHGKQYIGDLLKYPRAIAHNQSSNQVETQYYGENIKGLAERMGNPEKSYTFRAANVNTLPRAGQLWDDDYYISTVAVEVNFDGFRCTVGLSKNFNRISKYIGANSYRRLYEVSEVMVQERQSIYTDYLVIADPTVNPPQLEENMLLKADFIEAELLPQVYKTTTVSKVSSVLIQGKTKNGQEELPEILLPVIASSFGNVMEFSWEFKDNFSAGMRAEKVMFDGEQNTFVQDIQYCDYYGRMYYEKFSLLGKPVENLCDPDTFPLFKKVTTDDLREYVSTGNNLAIVKRKDSREALKGNYAVEFVTDAKGMIIGSGMAANNPLIVGKDKNEKIQLVLLKNPINKFSNLVNLEEENVVLSFDTTQEMFTDWAGGNKRYLEGNGVESTAAGAAWAYVTPIHEGEAYEVEDEDGNVSTITPKYGGELLFGRNVEISVGDKIGAFKAFHVHDIFEYLKQKEA